MKIEQINNLNVETPDHESWDVVIKFIRDRFYKRYFNQIEILQKHVNKDIRNNCGFIILSVDCIVIETLQQFYEGKDESQNTASSYLNFFKRNYNFSSIINTQLKAKEFASQVRSGLLHQAKTKGKSILNKKKTTPLIAWVDENEPRNGLVINRDLFHKEILFEFENYIQLLKIGERIIREKCIMKLKTIVID